MSELLSQPEKKNYFLKLFPPYKRFCLYVYLNQNRDPPSFLLIFPLHLHPLLIHFPEFPNQYTGIKFIRTSALLMAALFDSTSALLLTQILIFLPQNFPILFFAVKNDWSQVYMNYRLIAYCNHGCVVLNLVFTELFTF